MPNTLNPKGEGVFQVVSGSAVPNQTLKVHAFSFVVHRGTEFESKATNCTTPRKRGAGKPLEVFGRVFICRDEFGWSVTMLIVMMLSVLHERFASNKTTQGEQ